MGTRQGPARWQVLPCPALMEKLPLEGGDPEAGRPRAQGSGQREGWSVPTAAVRAGTGPAARPQGRSTRLRGCRPQAHDGARLLHQKWNRAGGQRPVRVRQPCLTCQGVSPVPRGHPSGGCPESGTAGGRGAPPGRGKGKGRHRPRAWGARGQGVSGDQGIRWAGPREALASDPFPEPLAAAVLAWPTPQCSPWSTPACLRPCLGPLPPIP